MFGTLPAFSSSYVREAAPGHQNHSPPFPCRRAVRRRSPRALVPSRAVEELSPPFEAGRPSADEIARAQTVPSCPLAYGDKRFDERLVRVTGTFQDSVIGAPLLLAEGCERLVFLEFDDGRIRRLTPDGNRQFAVAAATDDLIDVVLVGRARTGQSGPVDRYGELTVYAIESVAPRR
jgi:hypothetical protein